MIIVVEKYNPGKTYTCPKCMSTPLEGHDITHLTEQDPEDKDVHRWRKLAIEHIVMVCRRCTYEIGVFLPCDSQE